MACSISNRSLGEGSGWLRVPLSLRGGAGLEVSICVSGAYELEVLDLFLRAESCAEVIEGLDSGLGFGEQERGPVDGGAGAFADGGGEAACVCEEQEVFFALGAVCEQFLDCLPGGGGEAGPREETGLGVGLGVGRAVDLGVCGGLAQRTFGGEGLREAGVPRRARSKW